MKIILNRIIYEILPGSSSLLILSALTSALASSSRVSLLGFSYANPVQLLETTEDTTMDHSTRNMIECALFRCCSHVVLSCHKYLFFHFLQSTLQLPPN
uniref:Uncharacterized protein n=1 Tax=Triticum urartu TaxID=4572 RepID=A0A8R7PFE2_TRIUA